VEDDEPRVVCDLQTKPQRAIDQVRLFASEQLFTESTQLGIKSSSTLEELTTKGHVRSPNLRLCFHGEDKQAARFEVHDRGAMAQISAAREPKGWRSLPPGENSTTNAMGVPSIERREELGDPIGRGQDIIVGEGNDGPASFLDAAVSGAGNPVRARTRSALG
jgi:hypothetical protein